MAAVIIILQKRPTPPTKAEIADVLRVEPRTISRWLAELRAAGCVTFKTVGKRRFYVFHEPSTITDPSIDDPSIDDPMRSHGGRIIDRWRTHATKRGSADHPNAAANSDDPRHESIDDRSSSGSNHDSVGDSELPTTSAFAHKKVLPEHIATNTGRWLVRQGFNIGYAYRFQIIPLEVAQADYARRRDLGQGNGAIINAWLVELPEFDLLSKESGTVVNPARRAELREKYGDLFLFAGDPQPQEGVE